MTDIEIAATSSCSGTSSTRSTRTASRGETPELPITARRARSARARALSAEAFGYVAGGAGAELTMRANLRAFERWADRAADAARRLRARPRAPRCSARRCPRRCCSRRSACSRSSIPRPSSPSAAPRPRRGCRSILSTAASNTIEDVAAAVGARQPLVSALLAQDRELAASFVARARRRGLRGDRRHARHLDARLAPARPAERLPAVPERRGRRQLLQRPRVPRRARAPPEEDPGAAIGHWAYQFANPAVTWADLAWLREQTDLPIVLKGILHAEDARRALDAGVDGVIVSNHGGRQVDGAIGALDALPAVRDGGRRASSRCCSTAASAPARTSSRRSRSAPTRSASGARTCGGSALDGQAGVEHVLRCLLAELDLTLALSGYTAIGAAGRARALRRSGLSWVAIVVGARRGDASSA